MMNGVASSGLTWAKFKTDNQMYLAVMLHKSKQDNIFFENQINL